MRTESIAGGAFTVIDEPVGRDHYSQRVLTENNIEGLCRLRIKSTDGERCYCYETERHKSLSASCETVAPDRDTLLAIVRSLAEMETELSGYLLDLNCLILTPEMIFIDQDGGAVRFCACPGYESEPSSQLRELGEWILQHGGGLDEVCGAMALEMIRLCDDGAAAVELTAELERMYMAQKEKTDAGTEASPQRRRGAFSRKKKRETRSDIMSDDRRSLLPPFIEKEKRRERRIVLARGGVRIARRLLCLLIPLFGLAAEVMLYAGSLIADFSLLIRLCLHIVVAVFFTLLTMLSADNGRKRLPSADVAFEALASPAELTETGAEEDLPKIRFDTGLYLFEEPRSMTQTGLPESPEEAPDAVPESDPEPGEPFKQLVFGRKEP